VTWWFPLGPLSGTAQREADIPQRPFAPAKPLISQGAAIVAKENPFATLRLANDALRLRLPAEYLKNRASGRTLEDLEVGLEQSGGYDQGADMRPHS
jgi:hypothetical protein